MKTIITDVIPQKQEFYNSGFEDTFDYKAITIFSAIGFFLETDTYKNNLKVLQPGTIYQLNHENEIINQEKYFDWSYNPREISLTEAVDEFSNIFENFISPYKKKSIKIVLPLSGGLDSRTQAVSLKDYNNVYSYSYAFKGGIDESKYGRKIADVLKFPFREYRINEGYLWHKIEDLAKINGCFTDFVNPRQMAIIDDMPYMGDVFYLGHWGDVLFDNYGIERNLSDEEQIEYLINKLVKKEGLVIANDLWNYWIGRGNFDVYFKERLHAIWKNINISNLNAKYRAFKSMYWAPRWTSASLSIFQENLPTLLPYYSKSMCEFISTVPENLLSNRQIQINYIKKYAPEIGYIEWQDFSPYNLYNYKRWNSKISKMDRLFQSIKRRLFFKNPVTRNWELQFIGENNQIQLSNHLANPNNNLLPGWMINKYLNLFKDSKYIRYAHPVSMLLTISKASL